MQENHYHYRETFDNGYEVSVMSKQGSYGWEAGLFEVAILHNKELVYDTPITNDVLGWRTFKEVADLIEQVKALPSRI